MGLLDEAEKLISTSKKTPEPKKSSGPRGYLDPERYSINHESGVENIPEGSRARTIDTETGEPIEGFVDFGKFHPGPTPLYKAPQRPKPSVGADVIGSLGQGVRSGMANVLGMPADAMSAFDRATGLNIPGPPLLGSQNMERALSFGMAPKWTPQTGPGKVAGAVGEQIGASAIPLGGQVAGNAKGGMSLMNNMRRPLQSTIGAGLGSGAARTAFPDSLLADVVATIFGAAAGNPRTVAGAMLSPFAEKIEQKLPSVGSALFPKNAEGVDQLIRFNYQKAVRPSTSSIKNFGDYKQYMDNAVGAVKQIVNLSRETNMPLPQTVEEFSKVLTSARNKVYSDYHALTAQTGAQGAMVNLKPIVQDLKRIATDPMTIRHRPEIAKFAEKQLAMYKEAGEYTPQQVELLIKDLNDELASYYAGRASGMSAKRAGIMDAVARNLRLALDDTITRYTGPGYQELKNKYGQLRSIEKDVTNRAVVQNRSAMASLLDFSDMFSASKAIYSAAKLDPAGAAAAGSIFAIKQGLKNKNNPDRIIQKMFADVDKHMPRQPHFAGPYTEERGFQMQGRTPDGIENPRAMVPTGRRPEPVIEGEFREVTPLPGGERAGALPSPSNKQPVQLGWNPQNTPGGPAQRTNPIQQAGAHKVGSKGPDFTEITRKLREMGFGEDEIRQMYREALEKEMLTRGMK